MTSTAQIDLFCVRFAMTPRESRTVPNGGFARMCPQGLATERYEGSIAERSCRYRLSVRSLFWLGAQDS